jgi:hypothetical protein
MRGETLVISCFGSEIAHRFGNESGWAAMKNGRRFCLTYIVQETAIPSPGSWAKDEGILLGQMVMKARAN